MRLVITLQELPTVLVLNRGCWLWTLAAIRLHGSAGDGKSGKALFFFPCLCLLLQEQKRKSRVLGTGWDFALRWVLVLNYIPSDHLLPCSSASKKHEAAEGVCM